MIELARDAFNASCANDDVNTPNGIVSLVTFFSIGMSVGRLSILLPSVYLQCLEPLQLCICMPLSAVRSDWRDPNCFKNNNIASNNNYFLFRSVYIQFSDSGYRM